MQKSKHYCVGKVGHPFGKNLSFANRAHFGTGCVCACLPNGWAVPFGIRAFRIRAFRAFRHQGCFERLLQQRGRTGSVVSGNCSKRFESFCMVPFRAVVHLSRTAGCGKGAGRSCLCAYAVRAFAERLPVLFFFVLFLFLRCFFMPLA